jgi:copper resistance protein C
LIKDKIEHSSQAVYAAVSLRKFMRIALLLALLGMGSQTAFAHTRLISSEPVAGAVLQAAPQRVVLQFSAPPEKGFTELALSQADKQQWQPLEVVQDVKQVRAALPPLKPGRYKIRWSVLSRDGHRQRGVFQFQIH